MTNNETPINDDQPAPGAAPNAEAPKEPLLSYASLGEERVLCLEAICAEAWARFERRRVEGVWKWRPPRNPNIPGAPPWLLRPPNFAHDMNSITSLDVITAGKGLDWFCTAFVAGVEGQNYRAWRWGLGRAHHQGQAFHAIDRYQALVLEMELGPIILLQQLSGVTVEGMHSQLFPHQGQALLSVVPSGPVS